MLASEFARALGRGSGAKQSLSATQQRPASTNDLKRQLPGKGEGSRKKRSQNNGNDKDDDSDQDEGNNQELAPGKVQFGIRLSCPIYLQNPLANNGCACHTLTNANYVKQHVKRCHVLGEGALLGPYCPRCRQNWPNDTTGEAACIEHCRSPNPCRETTIEETGRLLLEEFNQIKLPKGNEIQRWEHLFRCLCKDAPLPASPYHQEPVARMAGLVFDKLPQLIATWDRPPLSTKESASLGAAIREMAASCGSATMVGLTLGARGGDAAIAAGTAHDSPEATGTAAVPASAAPPLSPLSQLLMDAHVLVPNAPAQVAPNPAPAATVAEAQQALIGLDQCAGGESWPLTPPSIYFPYSNAFLHLTDTEWTFIGNWLTQQRSISPMMGYSLNST